MIHTHLLSSFPPKMICLVLALSVLVGGGGATAAYEPIDVFLINCGADSWNIDTNGRNWSRELPKFLPSNWLNSSYASQPISRAPNMPYMNARTFRSQFTYSFPVSPGSQFLRLYFYLTFYNSRYGSNGTDFDATNSFFSVTANGFTLLNNFTTDLAVKASTSKVLVKEFILPVHQKLLNLTFKPSPNSLAFVNGIEIVSMPHRFYTKGGTNIDDGRTTVHPEIYNSTAFETLYRLNVGGQTIRGVDDSGMFRQWLSDDDFILNENLGFVPRVPDVKINYTNTTPAYVAPEDVYTTCRTTQTTQQNQSSYLTWVFTVDTGFNYLVRLHFCETLPEVTKPGQRKFTIFIRDQIAKTDTDVIGLSGGSRIPVYLDFVTFVASPANETRETTDLRLRLYPYKGDSLEYYGGILNGIEILKLNTSKGNLISSNHKPKLNQGSSDGPSPNPHTRGSKLHIVMKILIAVAPAIGLASLIAVLFLLKRRMKRGKDKENSAVMLKVLLKQYTYAEVKTITKSFSHTIGKGGFGTVYSGNLSNGRKVAVKVLKDSNASGEDFMNEVGIMSQTSHVNIVSLLGFCYEGSRRAIVYEFLENGSLDQFISRKRSLTLDVKTLYGIALGTARGLEYLHYGCNTRIVHFDIKPQNILLDDNLCAKVSDFGLAKLCEKRESIVSLMDARGTIGYIAPEVFSRMYGSVSHKSDVYSYGMLVLEMIGARNKGMVESITSNASSAYFPDWIYKDLDNEEQTWTLGEEINDEEKEIAKKMILVSLWCIQPSPSDRPPMNRIVEMMEGNLDAVDIPPKPSMHISNAESSSLFDSVETGEKSSNL